MLLLRLEMQTVFIVAADWTLRAAVRAELRELGVKALGMESADDVGKALAAGESPSLVLLEGLPEFTADPAIAKLAAQTPTVVIGSRTSKVDFPAVAAVLYKPVRIAEIVQRIQTLLNQPRLA